MKAPCEKFESILYLSAQPPFGAVSRPTPQFPLRSATPEGPRAGMPGPVLRNELLVDDEYRGGCAPLFVTRNVDVEHRRGRRLLTPSRSL